MALEDDSSLATGKAGPSGELVEMLRQAEEMLKHMGLDGSFFDRMQDGDDWGFVLKAHGLIESAVDILVIRNCFQPLSVQEGRADKLVRYVAKLNLNGRTGKLELLKAYGVLSDENLRFINGLSEVRNMYAHSVHNHDKSITDIITADHRLLDALLADGVRLPANIDNSAVRYLVFIGLCFTLWSFLEAVKPKGFMSLFD